MFKMAASIAAFSRVFSQKCRIFSVSIARPCLLNNGSQRVTSVQPCSQFSDDLPSRPKRPISSFFQFVAEQRPQVMADNPDLNVPEIGKIIGAMWREMPEEEKEIYKTQFDERRAQFHEEMEAFRSRLTDEQRDTLTELGRQKREMRAKRRHRMEMKKLNKPKRPPSGYSLFVKAHVSSSARPSSGQTREDSMALFREAAEVWKTLPEYEKQQYNEEAASLGEAYREEMAEWRRRMEEEDGQ